MVQGVLNGFDGAKITNYSAAIKGLSLNQAQLLLSTQGLNSERSKEILIEAGLLASENAVQAELLESTLLKAGLNKEERTEILNKLGLIKYQGTEAITQGTCTAEDLKAALAQKFKNAEDAEGILTALGLAGANATTTTSFGLLTKSIWANIKAMLAWMVSNPFGQIMLGAGILMSVVGIIDLLTTSVEEHREQLSDLKSEYSEIKSELDGVNSELESTQNKIKELESKGTLTLTEAEELENLRKQNNELKRQNDLLEIQEKIKAKEVNDKFVDTMEADAGKIEYASGNTKRKATGGGYTTEINVADITEKEHVFNQIEELSKLHLEKQNATTEEQIKTIDQKIKTIDDYIQKKNKEWIENAEGIEYIQNPTTEDDKKVNEWLDYINDFQDKMAIAIGGDNAKENVFNRLVDNWQFDELLSPLQKLGKEGKVTAEMLNDSKYDAFIQKLIDIGFISDDTEGSLRFVASAFNGTMKATQKYVTSLKGDEINKFVNNLDNEAKALGTTESELAKLTAAHVIFNDTGLSTEQQQQALQMLASKIATTSAEMTYLLRLFNVASGNFDVVGASTLTDSERASRTAKTREYLKKKYGIDLSPIEIPEKEDYTPPYTSPGDKDKTNEALDNYLKDAENRYKIHQDEIRYIEDLQYAYDNLTRDEKERLDITGKINEAYRDLADNRIKDIEHQIDLAKELNEYADVTDYYRQIQNVAHEEANRLRAMGYDDNSNEIQDLQNKWWDAQNKIADESYSNSDRWINERNTYNDWELYGDTEVAAWERVLKRFKAEFPNELETIKEIEQNIFEARKEAMEKSIDDIEDYITARNTYNDWDAYGDSEVKAIQRQTKIIEDMYNKRLLSREEYIDKLEEQSQRIYSLAQDEIDKNLSNIDKYIDARNHYNDWDEFGDSEVKAIKRQIQYLDAAYKQKLISYEDYTEKVAEYTQKMYSAAKDNIIKEVSELIEDYEEMKQFESSQLESQKTLLQSYYDVVNAIAEAQHEINKELKASQSMYEYLNEDTRELLFNQEDYEILNKELLDIQTAANELQEQYNKNILNANAETIAEITEQYQMQYETLMKQYEISKAELEVAKKRQQLDNVLAERNTRMFINGQWQWVAKTQDVINAQNELADAEIQKKKVEASLEQTEAINKFTENINSIETDLNKVRKYWDDIQEVLNGESDEVAKALRQISRVSSPELRRVIQETGGSIGSFSVSLSESTQTMSNVINENLSGVSLGVSGFISNLRTYSNAIMSLASKISGDRSSSISSSPSESDIKAQMAANSAAWHTAATQEEKDRLHDANVELAKQIGLDEDDYNSGTGKWNYHASGTRYTPGGFTALGEEGFEAFITNNGRLIPINQPTIGNIGAGGIVFNREQMANLRTLWDWSNIGKMSPYVSSSNANSQSTVIDNSIHINGLTVSEQGNEDWINGFRRYVATHK